MELLQPFFGIFYTMFIQILPPEDDSRVDHYPFSPTFDFNLVVKYLFAFEIAFFESVKLDRNKIAAFKQFLKKFPEISKTPGSKVRKMALLPTVAVYQLPIFGERAATPISVFVFFLIFIFLTLGSHN